MLREKSQKEAAHWMCKLFVTVRRGGVSPPVFIPFHRRDMRGVFPARVLNSILQEMVLINIKIVAFIALHSVEYTDLMPDTIFYCTYFV